MKKRGNGNLGATLRGVVLGVLITVLVLGVAVPGLAATTMKTIEVAMGDIKIYIDGNLQHPTDVNGNTVQPFIYQGTTYLPVRALTNMLTDKAIGWDGETTSVFIGTQPKKANTPLEEMEPLEKSKAWKVETGRYAYYSINGKEYAPNNAAVGSFMDYNGVVQFTSYEKSATFKLDKQYSGIQGKFVLADANKTVSDAVKDKSDYEYIISFYEVDSEGKERLIADFSAQPGDETVDVFVDLSGIDLLKVGIKRYKESWKGTMVQPIFYDVNLIPEWIMD